MKHAARRFFFFLLFANGLFIISQIPVIVHIILNPKDALYPLVHFEFTHDFYAYLAVITQGKAGYFLHFNSYSSEPSAKGIFLVYYLFWGHIARLFSLSSYETYHISRIISLEFFLTSLYLLVNLIIEKKYVIWASLLPLIITIPAPGLYARYLGQLMNYSVYPSGILWWLSLDAFDRLNAIPHHLFGQAALTTGIVFLLLFLRTSKLRFALYSGLILFIGGVVFPAVLAVPIAVVTALVLLRGIRGIREIRGIGDIRKKMQIWWFTGLLIVLLCSLTSLSIALYQEHQGFPWDDWRMREFQQWNVLTADFNRTLVFSFAPSIALGAVSSFILLLSSPTDEYIVLILWAFLPFLLLPFANILGIPKIRLTQLAPFVPLGILTARLIFRSFKHQTLNKLRFILFLLLAGYSLSVSGQILINRTEAAKMYAGGHQIHIPNTEIAAMQFIAQTVPKESVFLSGERPGNIIPAFAPIVSYVGHSAKTKDMATKLSLSRIFFNGKLSDADAREFLKQNRISYVWFGPDEKFATDHLNYSFLKEYYNRDNIQIYRVDSSI